MPTEAFYKLDIEKKQQLIDSAIHEFSELPYEKVSIFKIAQNAEVSRSGFYYYFRDKRDIYEYLISEIKAEFIEKYEITYKPLDIFSLGENIFSFIAEIKGTQREKLFRRIVSNTKADDMKVLFTFMSRQENNCHTECCMEGVSFESADQLNCTVLFMATGIMYSLTGYLDNEYDLETAEYKLQQMFSIIRSGIVKGV